MKQVFLYMKQKWVYSCVLFCIFSAVLEAAEPSRRTREDRNAEKEQRKQQMRQDAQAYTAKIDQSLKDLLEPTQKNQRPQEQLVQNAQTVLDESKRYAPFFDDKQKGRFMLLKGWTSFYQGNGPQAVNWSMRACKTDEASQDAWNSQALFSMLLGKRPMIPRMEKPKARPRRTTNGRRRRNEEYSSFDSGVTTRPYTDSGVLEFDLLGLRSEMFREQFGRLQYQTVDGSKVEFTPGKDTLCILFWQDDKVVSDANDISAKKQEKPQQQPHMMDPMMMEMPTMGLSNNSDKMTLQAQRDYVKMLKDCCKEKPIIKFVQINTNELNAAENAATQAAEDPDVEQAGPLVFAADPASEAQMFIGVKAEKPFMMIVDTDGKVKYAGTAAGFMPAFILTELTGVEIDLAKQKQQQMTIPGQMPALVMPENMQMMMDPMMMEMMMQQEIPVTQAKPVDPNKPVADPNMPTPKKARKSPASDFPTQTIEDQIKAEKLLQAAEIDIQQCRKVGGNPREGIEAARKVLSQYPSHAQQARELLRLVPDRWKKQYNITDEELGY